MELAMSITAPSAESLSEHDLINAARDGDDRAFEELYARYTGRITAFIHARVRDHGRSEDVAQEVFIAALRRLRASSQPIQFKPWIYEIAKNACIDEFRRTRRSREVSLDSGDDESGPLVMPSRAPTPPAAIETKQQLTDLRGAFGGLSASHHQLLVLREFEGLSYDEIGARTGMSRQMVESALFRARRKLTEEYEELASGRRCRQIQSTIDDGRALSARALGVRERRVFARHLAHCQACRVSAHLAGVDETLVSRRRIGAKIAALLPLPLWRWPWSSGRSRQGVLNAHRAVQALSQAAEPAAGTAFGGAAVAVAVLALAGAGTVPAAATLHPPRTAAHPAVTQPVAVPAAAVPATGHAVSPGLTPAPAHGRVQLAGASRTSIRAGKLSPLRHSRRIGRAGAGTATPGGSAPGTPAATGATTPAPLTLSRAAGVKLPPSLGGAHSPVTHMPAGLPVAPVISGVRQTLGTGTGTASGAVSGVPPVTNGAGPAASALAAGATGVSQAAGPTLNATSQVASAASGTVSAAAGQVGLGG